jgi:hypothetical protein
MSSAATAQAQRGPGQPLPEVLAGQGGAAFEATRWKKRSLGHPIHMLPPKDRLAEITNSFNQVKARPEAAKANLYLVLLHAC